MKLTKTQLKIFNNLNSSSFGVEEKDNFYIGEIIFVILFLNE
jgi:hypothetical protein